eukprot:Blabericola_migrator_1__1303@NODE_133_length_13242_cov_100_720987_g17_i1_p4_GENE_NODE_133_length_13242_cov_100_720987_g17_i1NODE_133_length_13242_cov_100_720987_g17_i1_p4_ORF_typecomplete_len501_score71_08PIPLCX/PF00388_19/1_5e13PIPLCY/PF00387_19/6_7e11C2/PF00168_30/2_7e09_NODE_133_length_13242_cov_100_720987_g17_i11079012292
MINPGDVLKDLILKGVRCIHFHLIDGKDEEPCVALKSNSRFTVREVLTILKRFAFFNNPYPFVLSLVVSLSIRQKVTLGHILAEILGSQLLSMHEAPSFLSPASLQEKFLIRMRKVDKNGAELPEGLEADENLMTQQRVWKDIPRHYTDTHVDYTAPLQPPVPPLTPRFQHRFGMSPKEKIKPGGITANLDNLYSLVFFQGVPLESLSVKKIQPLEVAVMNSYQFSELTRNPETAGRLVRYSKNGLFFVYSIGRESLPLKAWTYGAHMVSVPCNSRGKANLLNWGKFLENGNCGYVLKPAILRQDRDANWDPMDPLTGPMIRMAEEIPIELTLKVITARQLPIPWLATVEQNRPSQHVNPFVRASIVGIPIDCDSRQTNTVTGNGFNPRWENETFVFEITVPSLAMLIIEVEHFDTLRCEPLASMAIPIMAVQQGFRWIPLLDMMLREVRWCGLLCQVSVKAAKSRLISARGSSDGYGYYQNRAARRATLIQYHQEKVNG